MSALQTCCLSGRENNPIWTVLNKHESLMLSDQEVQGQAPGKQETRQLRGHRHSTYITLMYTKRCLNLRGNVRPLQPTGGESTLSLFSWMLGVTLTLLILFPDLGWWCNFLWFPDLKNIQSLVRLSTFILSQGNYKNFHQQKKNTLFLVRTRSCFGLKHHRRGWSP